MTRAIVSYGANEGSRVQASDEFARALRAHGVKTELIRLPGAIHSDAALDFGEARSAQFSATMALFDRRKP